MKYGYPSLQGEITDPVLALPKILLGYFYSDSQKHGIELETFSFRADLQSGEDVVDVIRRSITTIVSAYFDIYTIELEQVSVDKNIRNLELLVSVTDNGKVVNFDKILKTGSGELVELVENGHL